MMKAGTSYGVFNAEHKKQDAYLRIFLNGFESSPNSQFIVTYKNKKPVIIQVNGAFLKYYGFRKKEIIGKNPNILKSGVQKHSYYKIMWKDLLNPGVGFWSDEIINKRKDGSLINVILTISTIFDGKNNPKYFFSSHIDVTARRKAENLLRQQAAFSKNNPYPVLRMDYGGRIMEYNPASASILKKKLAKSHPYRVFTNISKPILDISKRQGIAQFTQKIGLHTFLFTVKNDRPTSTFYIYGSDISNQVKSEEKLKRRNKELIKKSLNISELRKKFEDKNFELESAIKNINKQNKDLIRKTIELTELRGNIEDKNFELQEANKQILNLINARTQFMNQAAHDLRTPITPIMMLIPTIKSRITDKNLLQDLEVIRRNAEYLKKIADNLITYMRSQKENHDYNFEDCDISKIIEDISLTYYAALSIKGIRLIKKITPHLTAEIDSTMISEVLQNIFSNELKFVPKGGEINISSSKKENFINIIIEDNGIGMSKKILNDIFKEFYKADRSRHLEGAGLGLSICREIINTHGGRIWAESKGRGKGSSFFIELPVKQIN